MAEWLITWTIDDEEAETPREAAMNARGYQRDPDGWTGCFEVRNKRTGEVWAIDLDADPDSDYICKEGASNALTP